jgi:transposase
VSASGATTFALNTACSAASPTSALDEAIVKIDREEEAGIAPFRTAIEQVSTIPGVKALSARMIISEIGTDMTRFASDAHLISWACICPRNDESAGKRRSSRIRKGSPWLKTTLVQCAWAAARTKGSYLQAQFHRIRARRGAKKAIVAVAASILTAIYQMLKDGTIYQDLGPNHFQHRDKEGQKRRLLQRLAELGFVVKLAPPTNVSP